MSITIPRHADQVIIGIDGAGWVAPLGTAKPSSPLNTPASPWKALGRVSPDGLTRGFSEDKQEFSSWGQTSPFRAIVTKSTRTIKIQCQETGNPTVQSLMHRVSEASLTPDVDGFISFAETASPAPDRRSFWFVVIDGSAFQGFYLPEAEVTDRADVTYKGDALAMYEFTITAYPDASGNTVYNTYKVPVITDPAS